MLLLHIDVKTYYYKINKKFSNYFDLVWKFSWEIIAFLFSILIDKNFVNLLFQNNSIVWQRVFFYFYQQLTLWWSQEILLFQLDLTYFVILISCRWYFEGRICNTSFVREQRAFKRNFKKAGDYKQNGGGNWRDQKWIQTCSSSLIYLILCHFRPC